MKFKLLLITTFSIIISTSLFAKPVIDSVGVKNNDGKKMILFKVKAKDTYYSIGKRYGIKPEALMKFNGKKKAVLSIGTIIEIPTEIPFKKSGKTKETAEAPKKETKKEKKERLAREAKEARGEKKQKKSSENNTDETPTAVVEQPTSPEHVVQQPTQQPVQQPVQQNNTPPIQYKVSAGETLYAISKRFNTTVDDITKLNNLTSTNLTPGQILLVHSGTQSAPPPPVMNRDTQVAKRDSTSVVQVNSDSSNNDRHLNANRYGLFEKNEKGVATWMDDPGLDPNKKLVLHRTAPIGTVIKLTNPMTNRTTFAKVVGRFTDNESTKDVIIVMTKSVADALGALDKRFHVDISYGSPNE
ncbi:LysM peptidoglycan-binding domain-containing protein [Mucilaginibacter sp.]|uniref:LysM peptidoglycan-binding domain-containing protein n=1 Tax=Mucilaginibacter sp. TaxID=1882438 RepID=UPI00284F8F5D|nr:LysM peptidoglycan-binding domain-containing protein [Mucilaginibacter sp.]MDR3696043.1 LysM peptidoglycan-binding domain-containing protein [Mucilaginibacter sp.]